MALSLIKKEDKPIKTDAWKEIQLSFHNFIVIKDLGMKFSLLQSKYKKRYVEVKCILCANIYRGQYALFKNRDKVCKCESKKGKVQIKWSNPIRDRLLKIRAGMIYRCHNEKCKRYIDYGARGIKVCSEWLESPELFYNWALNNGYKEGLTIERINNEKGYNPKNCTWIPKKDQSKNRRINISKDECKKIKNLLEKGLSKRKVASISGRCRGTINKISLGKYSFEKECL